jgi:hypothetical protein
MIEMNGPDIEEVDEVKVLILESVNVWNYENVEKRVSSRGSQGFPCAQKRPHDEECLLATLGT